MSENPSPTPAPDPAPPAPAPPAPEPEFKPVTSQEQFDAMVKDRIARERAKTADYEELKKKADRLAELEAADQTELERAQKALADEQAKSAKAEGEAKAIRLRAAIVAEAARSDREKKVSDLDLAVAALTGHDSDLLELDKDGNPTDIAKAMDSLLEKRPALVAAAPGGARPGGADQGARGGGEQQLGRDALKDMSPDAVREALKDGKLDTVLGGGK